MCAPEPFLLSLPIIRNDLLPVNEICIAKPWGSFRDRFHAMGPFNFRLNQRQRKVDEIDCQADLNRVSLREKNRFR